MLIKLMILLILWMELHLLVSTFVMVMGSQRLFIRM
ncbi:hypothetical protein AX13_01465 [Comamonas aquatica DA1877]|uniref:Uncharacterized protein n=1 Tax=Comamonas aquatica DA1877 TaxID=1457173 RepID=A0A014QAC9_9BURK|nr:hypothetical protein AX13_01465 [Comamonas aquatica DA1877]